MMRPPRRWRIVAAALMAIAALVVLTQAALPMMGVGLSHSVSVGEAWTTVSIDRALPFWSSDCVTATWDSGGVSHIFRNGKGTIGTHTETLCPADVGRGPLVWRVHYGDNVWRTLTLHPYPLTLRTVAVIVVLIVLAAWVAARPLRFVTLNDARRWHEVAPYLLPALLPLGFLWLTNAASIDFGWHWDEITLVNQVRRVFNEGTLIPDFYNYPSLSFGLMLVALLRNPGWLFSGELAQQLQIMEEHEYWHFARLLFLSVSSLAVLWTYTLTLVWRRSVWAALLSASLLATAWEVTYHLRYIAPDGLLMSFGALTLLLTVAAYRWPERPALLWGAVTAAGFAVGSKYPGGLIIVPVFMVAVLRWWGEGLRFWIGRLVRFGAVFVLAYLLTTPGTLLNFPAFWYDVTHEISHYGEMGQGYYTVEPGGYHLSQLTLYLSLVAFSHANAAAALVMALAVVGTIALLREDWRLGVIVLAFPIAYVLYFSTQRVMYVRNMLVTLPYWATLATIGAGTVWQWLRGRGFRAAWALLLVAVIGYNVGWQLFTVRTIHQRGATYQPAALVVTAREHPDTRYWAAEGLYDELAERYGDDLPANIGPDRDGADVLAVWHSKNLLVFDSNYGAYLGARLARPWADELRHFGPYEVNMNYYPGWDGDNRIVLVPMAYVATDTP